MTKQNILKSIVIVLSLGIILCTYLIFVKILTQKVITTKQSPQSEINFDMGEEEKVKQILVENKKIYILTTTPKADRIIVIDEEQAQKILTIHLNKGDNKNE